MKVFRNLIIISVIGGGLFAFWKIAGKEETNIARVDRYLFSTLQRQSITNLVSATGELSAREIVEVGTQVSGIIEEVFVDFNDSVVAGQLIARIDQSVLDTQVKGAEADLMRAKAQLKKARSDYERYQPIHEQGYLADKDFVVYEFNLETAKAQLMDAEANYERANRNRSYADITAPISGVVIDRQVEKGQTVAASFNTPELFTIAEDLSLMEIIANVDETDIGQIEEGQEVRFTVAAYADDTFEGVVTQLRLQPTVIQNVVNYQVVIETENPSGKLLPGMTATIDFVVDQVVDVWAVPASALSLKPNEEMLAVIKHHHEERGRGIPAGEVSQSDHPRLRSLRAKADAQGNRPASDRAGQKEDPRIAEQRTPGKDMAILWYKNSEGELNLIPVERGVSDGILVEVNALRGRDVLTEGLEIITRMNVDVGSSGRKTRSASEEKRPAGGPPGGPPGGLKRLGF